MPVAILKSRYETIDKDIVSLFELMNYKKGLYCCFSVTVNFGIDRYKKESPFLRGIDII